MSLGFVFPHELPRTLDSEVIFIDYIIFIIDDILIGCTGIMRMPALFLETGSIHTVLGFTWKNLYNIPDYPNVQNDPASHCR